MRAIKAHLPGVAVRIMKLKSVIMLAFARLGGHTQPHSLHGFADTLKAPNQGSFAGSGRAYSGVEER